MHFSSRLVFLVLAFSPAWAHASGSVALSDLMPLVQQSPRLLRELGRVLRNTRQQVDDVTCEGTRLGRQYGPVAAARVAPYTCSFGMNTTLTIEAQTRFLLADGTEIDPTEGLFDEGAQVSVAETLTRWNWR